MLARLTTPADGGRDRNSRLASVSHRREVASGLRRMVKLAAESSCCGASSRVPLRRREILQNRSLLLALAQDLEQPGSVQPHGVRLASRLVEDVSSPAFAVGPRSEELDRAVRQARTALHLAESPQRPIAPN